MYYYNINDSTIREKNTDVIIATPAVAIATDTSKVIQTGEYDTIVEKLRAADKACRDAGLPNSTDDIIVIDLHRLTNRQAIAIMNSARRPEVVQTIAEKHAHLCFPQVLDELIQKYNMK